MNENYSLAAWLQLGDHIHTRPLSMVERKSIGKKEFWSGRTVREKSDTEGNYYFSSNQGVIDMKPKKHSMTSTSQLKSNASRQAHGTLNIGEKEGRDRIREVCTGQLPPRTKKVK